MHRQRNADRLNAEYDFDRQAITTVEPGFGYVSTETRYIGVAKHPHPRPKSVNEFPHRWVGADSEDKAFEQLAFLAHEDEDRWQPVAVYDLDTGELICIDVAPPQITRSGDHDLDYPNPCAVHVFDGHWPQTTDGWIALGFDQAEAEQLVTEPKPKLDKGCDRFMVEWIVDCWVIFAI